MGNLSLDRLISFFLNLGVDKGLSLREIQSRLRDWLSLPPPDHFLVIEPDPELRRIIVAEIKEATGARATGAGPDECANAELLSGSAPVALFSKAELVRAALPQETYLITLRSRSVSESSQGEKPPPADALIAIVSSWPEFLSWSHTLLVAAGVDPKTLSIRDAREKGWERGLGSIALVITDSLLARQLPHGCTSRVFRVISDSSVAELRAHVEQFFVKSGLLRYTVLHCAERAVKSESGRNKTGVLATRSIISSMLEKLSSGKCRPSESKSLTPHETAPKAIPSAFAAWRSLISSPIYIAGSAYREEPSGALLAYQVWERRKHNAESGMRSRAPTPCARLWMNWKTQSRGGFLAHADAAATDRHRETK